MSDWIDYCQAEWWWKFQNARLEYLKNMQNRNWMQDVELKSLPAEVEKRKSDMIKAKNKYLGIDSDIKK